MNKVADVFPWSSVLNETRGFDCNKLHSWLLKLKFLTGLVQELSSASLNSSLQH